MGPVVAEVEDIDELLPGLEAREPQVLLVNHGIIDVRLVINNPDTSPVAQCEFMQV